MQGLIIPDGYRSTLPLRETQKAIKLIKDTVQHQLAEALHLDRITAPIVVHANSGINDDLNGVERKVSFSVRALGSDAEIVQSLAKWKRQALWRYGYRAGEGIYTDMNAIRRDDDMDNLHSVFVDQWDWELVIEAHQRTPEFLQGVVQQIVSAFVRTQQQLQAAYPVLTHTLKEPVYFITSQELEDAYPDLSPKEREHEITRLHRTVFIRQIGAPLKSGIPHDGRAPDYDDWALNGDILFWSEVLQQPMEISSMGIRVDSRSLEAQLRARGCEDRLRYDYHRGILEGALPLTIGGGIGQSRLCMLLLQKAHIGEVQVSVWDKEMVNLCKQHNIFIL
ncbi:MAG: aspartate--ammonia ligase [Eubacteriales bacterium]